VLLAFLGSSLGVSYRTPLSGCARDNGTGGASGVYRWADRIGIPVRLLEVPAWEDASPLRESAGNCVLTMGNGAWSPTGSDLEPASWQKTREWLGRGNTLFIVTRAPRSLPAPLRRDLLPSDLGEISAERATGLGQDDVDSRPETSQAELTSGEALTVEANGPRWNIPTVAGPKAGASGKAPSEPAAEADRSRWRLAGDPRGGVLFRIPSGRGAVYVLLDEFAWTNAGFDHGDNARVLAELVRQEIRGGVFAFDEYRHGHGRTESFVTYIANLPGSSAFLWLTAIWALLYLYARNVRLKPVEAYREKERRTAQEYIDAVAQLYERAQAAPLVVEAVARRLRQLSRASAEHPPSVDTLLHRAQASIAAGDRPSVPTAAIALVKDIIQLRKRIYGTRTFS
jgi:hypothetical protein